MIATTQVEMYSQTCFIGKSGSSKPSLPWNRKQRYWHSLGRLGKCQWPHGHAWRKDLAHEFSQQSCEVEIAGFVILLSFINGKTGADQTQGAILGVTEGIKLT